MAGGIDWFRWHHGSVTDPKLQLVANKAKSRFGDVIAVWAFVLEKASADEDRGAIGRIDFEALDFLLGAETGTAVRILDAMTARGLIAGNRVAAWEQRQPKRERPNDHSTQRSKAFRERHATPRNATERHETPRGEESREERSKDCAEAPDPIFGTGLDFLKRKSVPDKSARSFLGLLRKELRDDLTVSELLTKAEREDVSDPIAWLRAAAKGRKARNGNGNDIDQSPAARTRLTP